MHAARPAQRVRSVRRELPAFQTTQIATDESSWRLWNMAIRVTRSGLQTLHFCRSLCVCVIAAVIARFVAGGTVRARHCG